MPRNPLSPFRSGAGGDPFLPLHREMSRLFDDFYRSVPIGSGTGSGSNVGNLLDADLDVSETENEFRVAAELPGVNTDDIEIRLDDDVLTIRGEKKFEREEGGEKENYHFVERSYGTFQRSLRLPTPVDQEQVKATCENGVLKITLPKSDRRERSRRIQVQGGQGDGGKRIEGSQDKEEGSDRSKSQGTRSGSGGKNQ